MILSNLAPFTMAYPMLDVKLVLGCSYKSIQVLEREMMQERERVVN